MEAKLIVAKRGFLNVKRALTNYSNVQSSINTRIISSMSMSSKAFATATSAHNDEAAHQSSKNTLAEETTGPPPSIDPTVRQNLYHSKQQVLGNDDNKENDSTIDSVSETSKNAIKKGADVAEAVGDAMKKTMDTAWSAGKQATEKVSDNYSGEHGDNDRFDKDRVDKIDGPVDMAEYRSLDRDDEAELRKKVGG
ncbi:hypothetical protein ACFE04_004949 [Oxalis oulophora]